MKFRSLLDKKQFIAETASSEQVHSLLVDVEAEDWAPTEEVVELFLKRRKELVGKLKSFRKSQTTKGQWRKNRYKIMKGIKAFHKSTKGKQFHRALSRFLVSRDSKFINSPFLSNEALKSLSSLETHLYIENDYYLSSPIEDMDRDLLFEELVPTINRAKRSLLKGNDISSADAELLLRVVDLDYIVASLASKYSLQHDIIQEYFQKAKEELQISECEDGYYIALLNSITSLLEGK